MTAIQGLPTDITEDRLKAIGAAAASSGAVALFHAIGVTPEARTWENVASAEAREEPVTLADLRAARDELSPISEGAEIGAVSVGTPHASEAELRQLANLVRGDRPRIPFYVNTAAHSSPASARSRTTSPMPASRSSPTPAPTSRP